jgi:hypothetical protein
MECRWSTRIKTLTSVKIAVKYHATPNRYRQGKASETVEIAVKGRVKGGAGRWRRRELNPF